MRNAATTVIKTTLLSVAVFLCAIISISHAKEKIKGRTYREKPRAVSLDYCADQFILSLADRGQIMALTRDATGEDSFYRARARGLPRFGASAEEILYKGPEVVIRSWGGYGILPLLKQADITVVSTRYGAGPKALYRNMRLVGAALGQQQRAQKMIADYQRRLDKVTRRARRSPILRRKLRTIYITPGGVTAGKGSFINIIIKLAGLTSIPEQLGLRGWPPLPLEALIQQPPDLIISSFFDQGNIHVSNWSLSRYSRIRNMLATIPTITVPGRYLSCNGIFTIEAAEYIQNQVEKVIR